MKLFKFNGMIAALITGFFVSTYSMETEQKDLKCSYQTYYQLKETVPDQISNEIVQQSSLTWCDDSGVVTFDSQINTFIHLNTDKPFSDAEYAKRYPWKLDERTVHSSILYCSGNNEKEVEIQSVSKLALSPKCEGHKIVGPNEREKAIVNDQVIDIRTVKEAQEQKAQQGFLAALKNKFTSQAPELITIPGETIAIHPIKNICALVKDGEGGLAIYNLDDNMEHCLNGSDGIVLDANFPVIAEFTHKDQLLVIHKGLLQAYSLLDYKLQSTLSLTEYVGKDGFVSTDFLEAERKRLSRNHEDNEEVGFQYQAGIEDFDYCSEYDPYVLLRVKFYYFMTSPEGVLEVRSMTPTLQPFSIMKVYHVLFNISTQTCRLIDIAEKTFERWFWDKSIPLYRLRNYTDWFATQLKERNTVSIFSWNRDDMLDYVLACAAYNWLQSARDETEGESLLNAVRESDHRLKLLWRTQYTNASGIRSNVFKDLYVALQALNDQ